MTETLFNTSTIFLYGRVMTDLSLATDGAEDASGKTKGPTALGNNNFLQQQMQDPSAVFAKIYGVGFDGQYTDLSMPAIFLVHGEGNDPEGTLPTLPSDGDHRFSDDIRMWSYDQSDFTLRLDASSGTFAELLVGPSATSDPSHRFAGADLRMRGADLRAKGADFRMKGADNRPGRSRGSSD